MKTFITAAAITLATFGAFAQEATPASEIDNFVSTRTRAEVVAEMTNTMARGEWLSQGEVTRAPEMERFVATRTRAEVVAGLKAAIQRGEHLSQGEA